MKHVKGVAFISLLLVVSISAYNASDVAQLYRDLFNGTNQYNKLAPPDKPTNVSVRVKIEEIWNVDDVRATLNARIRVNSWWRDDRLLWEKHDYDGLHEIIVPPSTVWKPDIALINSASDMNIAGSDLSPITLVARNFDKSDNLTDGVEMQWSPMGVFETKCNFDLISFPFDSQKCEVTVGTLGSANVYIYFKYFDCTQSRADLQSNTWTLKDINKHRSDVQIDTYTKQKQHSFTCVYTLKRKPAFYVNTIIIPLIFLGIMTPFVFLIKADDGERTTFVITLFLSFAVYNTIIMDALPNSDTTTYLQRYIALQLAITAYDLINSVVQSYVLRASRSSESDDVNGSMGFLNKLKVFDICCFIGSSLIQVAWILYFFAKSIAP